MKIENVYSEVLTQKDDYNKLLNGIIDEPTVAIPWLICWSFFIIKLDTQ